MTTPTYTKAELLAWLKDEKRMLGWDAIVALKREPTNALLLQQYIENFNRGSYWSGIGGFVPTGGNDFTEAINDFTLDVPRLFYEDTGLDGSRANLEMAIIEGSQLSLLWAIDHWTINRIYEYTPTEGPRLFLDLLLSDVPGLIDGDRRIRLDLRHSSHFRLTFAKTPLEQEKGGEYFQKLFEQMPAEQRIWTMGEIREGHHPMMQPQSFGLRTQQGGEEGEGAILAFVRMQGRHEGGFPGADSGFRYLIPKDAGKDYSATVLINRGRVLMAQLLESFGELIGDHNFNCVFDDDNELILATATGGRLNVPGQRLTDRFSYSFGYKEAWAEIAFGFDDFSIPMANALVLEVKGQEVTVRLNARGIMPIHYYGVVSDPPLPEDDIPDLPMARFYALSVLATYELLDNSDGGEISLKTFVYEADAGAQDQLNEWVAPLEAPRDGLTPEDLAFFMFYVLGMTILRVGEALVRVLLSPQFKGVIEAAFKKNLPSSLSIREFVEENLKLNFGNTIVGNEIHSPSDVSLFGRINPDQISFAITTPELLLAAGDDPYSFQTQPVISGLRWTLEDLRPGARSTGSIDPASGVYQVPLAGQIDGRFTRVRITATDPATGFRSSALVTVVVDRLTMNPLFTYCSINERVGLNIGVLGDGPVEVTVKNPGSGSGSIEQVGGVYTYVAGPLVENETYVMDEVVATYKGQTKSV